MKLDEIETRVKVLETDPLTGAFDTETFESRADEVRSEAAELARWIRCRLWNRSVYDFAMKLAKRLDKIAGCRLPRFDGYTSGVIYYPPIY